MHGLHTGRRLALASALLAASALVGGAPAHAQRPASPAPAAAPSTARVGTTGLAVTRACRGRHTIAYFRKHHCPGYR